MDETLQLGGWHAAPSVREHYGFDVYYDGEFFQWAETIDAAEALIRSHIPPERKAA